MTLHPARCMHALHGAFRGTAAVMFRVESLRTRSAQTAGLLIMLLEVLSYAAFIIAVGWAHTSTTLCVLVDRRCGDPRPPQLP